MHPISTDIIAPNINPKITFELLFIFPKKSFKELLTTETIGFNINNNASPVTNTVITGVNRSN